MSEEQTHPFLETHPWLLHFVHDIEKRCIRMVCPWCFNGDAPSYNDEDHSITWFHTAKPPFRMIADGGECYASGLWEHIRQRNEDFEAWSESFEVVKIEPLTTPPEHPNARCITITGELKPSIESGEALMRTVLGVDPASSKSQTAVVLHHAGIQAENKASEVIHRMQREMSEAIMRRVDREAFEGEYIAFPQFKEEEKSSVEKEGPSHHKGRPRRKT